MNKFKWALFLVALLLVPISSQASDPGDFYLRLLKGDVQIKTGDNTDWVPAASNMPVYPGDKLWVPDDGRAEVQLRDGTSVRLGRSSAFEIGQVEQDDYLLYLDQGQVYINFRGTGASSLIVETPDAAFRTDGASLFEIEARENGDTTVSVVKGALYVSRDAGEMRAGPGERFVLRNHGASVEVARLAPENEWERWNRQRDQEAYNPAMAQSAGYLPEELQGYAPDFDSSGRWQYAPDYGYVWTPTVVVGASWSPYRVGRWVWIRGDYVWVSSERWGWVPYHYGRWAYLNRVGWCWVPPRRGSVYWGPGYVGWVHTPTHVAWVPLAPGETYYGRGHYGPNSVNITQVHVPNTTITNVYKNVYVTNGVTTVQRDTFLTGRPAVAQVRENLFLKERPSLGAPPIAPIRATAMPVVKEIPLAKQPPARVRQAPFARPHETPFRPGPTRASMPAERQPTGGPIAAPQQNTAVSAPARLPAPWTGAGLRPGAPPAAERPPMKTPGREEIVRYTTADVATTRPDRTAPPSARQGQQAVPGQQNGMIGGSPARPQGKPDTQVPRPIQEAQPRVIPRQPRPQGEAPLAPSAPPHQSVARPAPGERQMQAAVQTGTEQRREPIMRRPPSQENRRPVVAGDQGRTGNTGLARPPEPTRVSAPPRPTVVPAAPAQSVQEQHRPAAQPQPVPPRELQQKTPDNRSAPGQGRGEKHGDQSDARKTGAPAREQVPGPR